jgi:hypothetical protein
MQISSPCDIVSLAANSDLKSTPANDSIPGINDDNIYRLLSPEKNDGAILYAGDLFPIFCSIHIETNSIGMCRGITGNQELTGQLPSTIGQLANLVVM